MNNEERMQKFMNRNVNFFPLFCALTWDVIFVWTISTMFFSTQKGLSNSEIIALDSILMLAGCLMCIPLNRLFQNVKPVICSRVGLTGYAIYLILCIFGTQYFTFAVGTIFLAFGYCICGVKVNAILNQSLDTLKRGKDYEKVYGKGLSIYQMIEAFGAVMVTYIYSYNAYLAYWISFGIVIFSILYSFVFVDPIKFQERNVELSTQLKKRKPRKPDGYKKLLMSGFLLSLLFFIFMMRGALSITGSAFKIYLQELVDSNTIQITLFGLLYAIYKLAISISSKYQFKFNLKFGVRSLIIFVAMSIISFVISGIMYLTNPTSIITIVVIVACTLIQGAILTPCRIFINNYLQVCTPKRNIDRAHSIRITVEYFGYAAISSLYALLLGVFGDNIGMTSLVYISILAIPMVISLILFIRALCKQYAKKYTIIKSEYTDS
ncbi:MAG: MFS transporter [Clostridia bacterium]